MRHLVASPEALLTADAFARSYPASLKKEARSLQDQCYENKIKIESMHIVIAMIHPMLEEQINPRGETAHNLPASSLSSIFNLAINAKTGMPLRKRSFPPPSRPNPDQFRYDCIDSFTSPHPHLEGVVESSGSALHSM
jgi:hypothetical protein